jgi:hypothetical protein
MTDDLPFDISTCTPLERMVLQLDDRIRSLEADRPVHEMLGRYKDVSQALWECEEELQQHMVSPTDYICMYLSLFQKLPDVMRVEQGWELVRLCKNKQYARVAHYIFHSLRCHGQREIVNHWRQHAPFVKQELPPTHRGIDAVMHDLSGSLTAVSMPLNFSVGLGEEQT